MISPSHFKSKKFFSNLHALKSREENQGRILLFDYTNIVWESAFVDKNIWNFEKFILANPLQTYVIVVNKDAEMPIHNCAFQGYVSAYHLLLSSPLCKKKNNNHYLQNRFIQPISIDKEWIGLSDILIMDLENYANIYLVKLLKSSL